MIAPALEVSKRAGAFGPTASHASSPPPPVLTPAETRVLSLLLCGLSNKEIAAVVARSEATVKNQVASILRKYRVPSRMRLLVLVHGLASG